MREIVKLGGFILVFIGTVGLLINEFVFDWARIVTITFACLNVMGLGILGFTIRGSRKQA